jgi:uncharacterized protein (TIGR03067 family)
VVAGGAVYKIQRDNQEITLTTDDPDIEVVLKRKGELVRIRDKKSGQAWELNTLTNQIGLVGRPEGLKLELPGKEPFVLRRKGEKVFTITRAPRAAASKGTSARADEKLIIGRWVPVAAELGGEPVPKAILDTLRPELTFSSRKVTWRVRPPAALVEAIKRLASKGLPKELPAVLKRGEEGAYHLDPTKTPRAVDLIYLGPIRKTMLGIYSLKGDTLKISMVIDPDRVEERPAAFATRPGVLQVTITFRRAR